MKEAETVHLTLEDTELSLNVALDEVGEAKALEQRKSVSEQTNAARSSTPCLITFNLRTETVSDC